MGVETVDFVRSVRHLARVHLKYAKRPRRYRQILRAIRQRRPQSILEIGVYQGVRAVEMIEAASMGRPVQDLQYFGFDLFELMTQDIFQSELSKWPMTEREVRAKLLRTGAQISLYKGLTSETLPSLVEERRGRPVDFVFIDGGHAVETIRADWNSVRQIIATDSIVLFDDYYVDCPDRIKRFGCNAVLDGLDPQDYVLDILPDIDRFSAEDGPLNVSIAKLQRRA